VSQDPTPEVQLSLVQIDNYGPWTVTPAPRRETDLQALQARLYADFADFVGDRDGYVFYGRFDNMVGVTNGIDRAAHARFQERVRNRYPVTVSVGVGSAATPVAALERASRALQATGSAQDPDRAGELAWTEGDGPQRATVAHFDVVDATDTLTDRRNAIDVDLAVRRASVELATHLRAEHDAVAQFVGGDNVIAVCPRLPAAAFRSAVDHVRAATDVQLQVGVGHGPTAHAAGADAKRALEECRETGTRVRVPDEVAD
jgi:GTP cyclohydrolase IIa